MTDFLRTQGITVRDSRGTSSQAPTVGSETQDIPQAEPFVRPSIPDWTRLPSFRHVQGTGYGLPVPPVPAGMSQLPLWIGQTTRA